MIGATATTAGQAGYVPAPQAGDEKKFLRGDGTWAEVATTDVDLSKYATTETVNAINERVSDLEEENDAMQDSMTWGTLE
jgi:phage I-like protein